jgi:hypothetical protein
LPLSSIVAGLLSASLPGKLSRAVSKNRAPCASNWTHDVMDSLDGTASSTLGNRPCFCISQKIVHRPIFRRTCVSVLATRIG